MKTLPSYIIIMLLMIGCWAVAQPTSQADDAADKGFIKILDGLQFPEGPAWDGKSLLYVSNCQGDWIAAVGADTHDIFLRASEEPFTFNKTNGLTFYKDGSLFACDFGRGAIVRITKEGKSEIYADGYEGKRFNRPNDLAFDPKGNLYFSDPNRYDRNHPDGVVYRVDAKTKQVTVAAKDLAFPNGLAFSGDGKWLYVCESAMERVLKFRVNKDGTLGDRSIFLSLPGGDPDGIALDRNGRLYVAHFGGGAIYVVNSQGKIEEILLTPGKKPSNLEFGDADMRTLYVTEDETNAVYKLRVQIPGTKLFCAPE